MKRLTLQQFLDERTEPGVFYTRDDGESADGGPGISMAGSTGRRIGPMDPYVRCTGCAHRCRLKDGARGICQVRFNRDGILYVPTGYVAGLAADPIEKKPFFHVLPGSWALSFGMLGCDFHCDFCQNWVSSQALRDPASRLSDKAVRDITAEEIVGQAVLNGCPVVTSTYNEPLITAEWSVKVFSQAKKKGLLTSFVSNGYATPEVLRALRPHLDLLKIDLKCFSDATYRKVIGGRLSPVLQSIALAKELGYWVEVVTLVVPGMNDTEKELSDMAGFVAGVSKDVPWHVTAFYPQYKMEDRAETRPPVLARAYQAGKNAGLRFVYTGNRPGQTGDTESTFCPDCGALLVERTGFQVGQNRLKDGRCPDCGISIPGVWKKP